MDYEILLLALFYSRDKKYSKKHAPITKWDAWTMSEDAYPGLTGMARSTLYRLINALVGKGHLRVTDEVRGRARDKQMIAITREGKDRLEKDLQLVEVEVKDLRRPAMTLPAFLDFMVLFWYVKPTMVISAVERRIESLRAAILAPPPDQVWEILNFMYGNIQQQARLEIVGLETARGQLREELRSRDTR